MAELITTVAEELPLHLLSAAAEDDGDLDSLFGGNDDTDLTSLFTAASAAGFEPSQEPSCEPEPSLPQAHPQPATNFAAQLSPLRAPTQVPPDHQQAPSWPPLSLPAVPDPLGAPLSHQDGLTSGDLVVSTQYSTHDTPGATSATASPEETLDDAALEAELESLWESITPHEQPVNAQAGSQESDQDDNAIPVTQIPGFRYAHSNTNMRICLPRRIDLDFSLADELVHYVTLNRNAKIGLLYGYLELSFGEGKRLGGEMRELLKLPPLVQCVEQPTSQSLETKRMLIRMALYMLTTKGWGDTWFGCGCPTAKSRTIFWPRDSTILVAGFVMLLYRMYSGQRQIHQTALRQARSHNSNTATASPSPSRSPSSSRAVVSLSPPLAPEGRAFFEALAKDASAAKKRKYDEIALGIGSQTPYELEVPANARLKYHVYVKDRTDGSDLAAPTTYRHTDYMIARGAFGSLKSAFETAGQVPTFEIQTPSGRKRITDVDEWEHAVLAIYNVRRSGGVVEVDVWV